MEHLEVKVITWIDFNGEDWSSINIGGLSIAYREELSFEEVDMIVRNFILKDDEYKTYTKNDVWGHHIGTIIGVRTQHFRDILIN